MSFRLGFIGTGVMGEAILGGIVRSDENTASDLYVFDIDAAKVQALAEKYQVHACKSIYELVAQCDIILLAVKPVVCQSVLENIAKGAEGKAVVSIVAGWNSAKLQKYLSPNTRVLCVMPNIPAVYGAGMSVLSANATLTADEMHFMQEKFDTLGETEVVDEKYFDIVTGISGSGPAYVFMFIEAMVSAGIYNGLPAKAARKLATQTVLGAATMLKSSDRHPADLRDAVCTPGGTTIEAVYELENRAFTATVMSAVDKCAKKYKQMVDK